MKLKNLNVGDRVLVKDIGKEGKITRYSDGPPREGRRKKRHDPIRWHYMVTLDDGSAVWRSKYGLLPLR